MVYMSLNQSDNNSNKTYTIGCYPLMIQHPATGSMSSFV